MMIYNSFDSRFMLMHSVVVIDGQIVFNVSYVSKIPLPTGDVNRLYNEYLKEKEEHEQFH